eukprot:SAG31_NODE_734_length_12489_cov_6.922034_1_plen_1297_part_00
MLAQRNREVAHTPQKPRIKHPRDQRAADQDVVPPLNGVAALCSITELVANLQHSQAPFPDDPAALNAAQMATAQEVISRWPDYQPTPLVELPEVAAACGVRRVLYKDESQRFGLQSFKALGGAYAVADLVAAHVAAGHAPETFTVATCTDGNHGRSVAWGAQLAGCHAKIYIHKEVSVGRESAMKELGADVIRINGNYDASLAACKQAAEAHGWQIVSDTSWDGYEDVPRKVMAGYSVMSKEVMAQMGTDRPTHCFLPVGVGGMAGAVVAPFWHDMGENLFRAVSVESHMSACFLESIRANAPTLVDIQEETLMAGLSCGEVSKIAWSLLQSTLSHSVSIADDAVSPLMKLLKTGFDSTGPIEAGECSTSGLAALLATKHDPAARAALGLDADSTVLLFGTEGATDPSLYASLTSTGAAPVSTLSPASSPVIEPRQASRPVLVGTHATQPSVLFSSGDPVNDVAALCSITELVANLQHSQAPFPDDPAALNAAQMATAQEVISRWPDYQPTPLVELPEVAAACGVRRVLYKDESQRFGLQSFKALGGAYAVADLVAAHVAAGHAPETFTVATCTDGNHGRSVAWGAQLAGCHAKIYIHKEVSVGRESAMKELGADVIRINGNYDASLAACKQAAEAHGWQIVSDTSWDGYEDVPRKVMAGYSVMSKEVMAQMGTDRPTHCFLPVGVGGMAGAVVAPFWHDMGENLFRAVSVESHMSACFLESIRANAPTLVDIQEETLMAGLSCGEVSKIAWSLLQSTLSHSVSIADDAVSPLMKLLKTGFDSTGPIEAGECSTSGLAALLATKHDPAARAALGLDADSTVLLFGTEGATDPSLYASLTGGPEVSTLRKSGSLTFRLCPAVEPAELRSVDNLTSLAAQGKTREQYSSTLLPPVFPREEYEMRWDRTRNAMKACGIDTLIVADPSNIFYLTGFDGWSFYQPQYVILTKRDLEYYPVIVTRGMDAAAGAFGTHLPLSRVLAYADKYVDAYRDGRYPVQLVCELASVNGWCAGKTIGVDMNSDYFTGSTYVELVKCLEPTVAAIVDDKRLVNWVRIVKSAAELELIRTAATIIDQTMERAMQLTEVDARGCDVAAGIVSSQLCGSVKGGGTMTAIAPIINVGVDSDAGHNQWSDRVLGDGLVDACGGPVIFELAGARHHYHCPMARTVWLGNPPEEFKAFEKTCYRAMQALLAIAVPGRTCHDLFWAFNNCLQAEGFNKASRVGYSFGAGFAPDWGEKTASVRDGDHTVLEAGMCLHIIAGCGDGWSFETSEAIVITESGPPELLHSLGRKLFIKPFAK